ncbi:hypothetical protein [Kluyvera georgiana]|uniref:hypothetical protein n=1 Tax=Kluyvera georgiana TaxID=73098 RepID=UPI003D98B96E
MKIIKGEDYTCDGYEVDEPRIDNASVTPGWHKHGYVYSLNSIEQKLLCDHGYKLVTNGWYRKGDFYEILDPKGRVVEPDELMLILKKLDK